MSEQRFSDSIRARARGDQAGHVIELGDAEVVIAVTAWPRFSVRVVEARDMAVYAGEVLSVVDFDERDDARGFAVTFDGLLALLSGEARHEGAPDPEVLASARAFVTSLSNAAGAPNAAEFLAALTALSGERALGVALHEGLFGRAA